MFLWEFAACRVIISDKVSSDELQDLEDSLALANRELNSAKESIPAYPVPGSGHSNVVIRPTAPPQVQQIQQGRGSVAPILEESDDLTRQIAEEVMKQNIGHNPMSIRGSICNGDAEESIKAIARSLSNTGMMLAAEDQRNTPVSTPTFQTQQSQSSVPYTSQNIARAQQASAYSTVEYFPPNVALQNIPLTTSSNVGLVLGNLIGNKAPIQISQVFAGQGQANMIPQNVTVTPQGIITSHVPTSSVRQIPTTTFAQLVSGGLNMGDPTSASVNQLNVSQQQRTAQQLSALVQQAAAQLPPLPPYKPRQQRATSSTSLTVPHLGPAQTTMIETGQKLAPVTVAGVRPVAVSTTAVPASVAQDLVVQQLNRQQEQILAQQILQQKLASLSVPSGVRMTLPSNQNLGFSTILKQGQIGRLNQGVVQTLPGIGPLTQLIRADFPTSQLNAPVALPNTNIVWTSPPNVTITSPNGLPRPTQPKTAPSKVIGRTQAPTQGSPLRETFIDLTETDPPPYEATQSGLAKTVPPPVYPTHTSTTALPGKS